MSELREFTRITRHLHVRVSAGGDAFSAQTENISLRGAFLVCTQALKPGSSCVCEFILDTDVPEISVRANAHVVRQQKDGIAVRFDELLGADSYDALHQLLLYNAVDPARVEQECEAHLGLVAASRPSQAPR